MRIASVLLLGLLAGCSSKAKEPVQLPSVQPDDVVVSWGMIGRSAQRDTMYMSLQADRRMRVVTKSPSGTMTSVEQTIGEGKYEDLVRQLRKLECCTLTSAHSDPPSPLESRPELLIDFGDLECQVALWDSEWAEGRARDCAAAVADVHGRSFLAESPDETAAR